MTSHSVPTLTRTPTPARITFQPTPAQQRLLDFIHANPSFKTVQELCVAADVHPSSYYRWCQDPAFRAWLSHEWSGRLLFEGWHMLNLARANMVRSSTHFRALFSLIFDPRGQAALQSWQDRLAATDDAAGTPSNLSCDVESNQQLEPPNESFSESAPDHPISPTLVVRHLAQAIELASQTAPPEDTHA